MYAINHTTHTVFSYSEAFENKIKELKAKSKKTFKCAFYRTTIKGTVWSFVETYEEAEAVKSMLFLGGSGE